jgi:iron(III) transport system substrate-binding protein
VGGPAAEAPAQVDGSGSYIVVYSDTARTESSMAALMETSPGLEAETYTLSSLDTYLRLRADQERGSGLPDLYLVSDAPRTLGLLAEGALANAVPAELVPALPDDVRTPLLAHHWSAVTLVVRAALSESSQLDTWWDLTRPEWRGRVVMPDPTIDERTLYWLTTVAQHGDEMAAAYQREQGRAVALDPDCPNAGWQWVKDLLRNAPVLVVNDAQVALAVGGAEAEQPRVGLCGSEQWERAERGELTLVPLLGVQPAAGLRWWSYLALVESDRGGPEGSAAAQEAIRWLMGDAAGGAGYAVWYKPGFYPARSDVPDPAGAPSGSDLAARLWELDAAHVLQQTQGVLDLAAPYVGHPVGGR